MPAEDTDASRIGRLLYLSGYALDGQSGATEHAWEVASGLASAGWDVTLLGPAAAELEGPKPPEVVPVRAPRPLMPLALRREVLAQLRRRGVDIAYVRPAWKTVLAVQVLRKLEVPYVVEVNSRTSAEYEAAGASRAKSLLLERFERLQFGDASGAACVTGELLDYARPMLPRGARSWVTGNGFNPVRVRLAPFDESVRSELETPRDDLVLVFVGYVNVWHGVDKILSALAQVSSARLWIVGDGPERKRLEDLAERLGLADRVTWFGWLKDERLHELLCGADVSIGSFGLSRQNMHEAQPLKVRFYLGSGLPVILRYHDPLVDETAPGVFRVRDDTGLVPLLRELQGDRRLRDVEFRTRIRSFAVERLGWDAIVRKTSAELSELAASSKRAHRE